MIPILEIGEWVGRTLTDENKKKTVIVRYLPKSDVYKGAFQILLNEKLQTTFVSTYSMNIDDQGYVYNMGVDPSICMSREDPHGFSTMKELKADFIRRAERRFPGRAEHIWAEIELFAAEQGIHLWKEE